MEENGVHSAEVRYLSEDVPDVVLVVVAVAVDLFLELALVLWELAHHLPEVRITEHSEGCVRPGDDCGCARALVDGADLAEVTSFSDQPHAVLLFLEPIAYVDDAVAKSDEEHVERLLVLSDDVLFRGGEHDSKLGHKAF